MARPFKADDRLDGWEAISDYLGWTPRTVIRWEKQKGLPVHRVAGGKRQPVYAYKHEIDAWFQKSGASGLVDSPAPATPAPQPDTVLHAEPNNGTLNAGVRSRWLTRNAAAALVAVVCGSLLAAIALRQT